MCSGPSVTVGNLFQVLLRILSSADNEIHGGVVQNHSSLPRATCGPLEVGHDILAPSETSRMQPGHFWFALITSGHVERLLAQTGSDFWSLLTSAYVDRFRGQGGPTVLML